jgi:exonuclease SbcC
VRLRKLSLRNFRAFSNAEQPPIDLDHSVVFFCGKNGAGKTSLFEALELCLTGSVERLAGIQGVGRVLVNVRAADAPARLTLEWLRDGSEGTTAVEIGKNQSSLEVRPALDKEQVNSFHNTTYMPQATMHRVISSSSLRLGEIIKILAVSEKTEFLLSGISQAGISRRDPAFQRMKEGYEREQRNLDDADARIKVLRDAIASAESVTAPLDSWSEEIVNISRQLALPLAPPPRPSAETLRDQIGSVDKILQSKLANAMQLKSEGENARLRCQRLIDRMENQKDFARLIAEKESITVRYESELKDLEGQLKTTQDGLTLLEPEGVAGKRIPAVLRLLIDARDQTESNVCPVCDRPLENLREHIERKLQNLTAEQAEYENRLSLARADLKRIQDSRRQRIKDLAEIKDEVQDRQHEEQTLRNKIEAFLADYWGKIGVDCTLQQVHAFEEGRINQATADIDSLAALAADVSRLRSEMSAASTRTSQLTIELSGLELKQTRLRTALAGARAALERADGWIDTVQWVHSVLSNQLEEALDTYANRYVSSQFAELFERICGHPYWRVTIPEVRVRYHRAEAEWNAAYAGEDYPGGAVFSQGELNSCALAMFLALATAQTGHPGLLLLDDPIQSMDEIRIEDFAQLLKSLKDDLGWQLIIALHEESVFDYLKRQLYPSSQGQSLVSYELVPTERGTMASEKEQLVFDPKDFLIPATDVT